MWLALASVRQRLEKEIFTTPNIITMIRMAVVPHVLYMMWYDQDVAGTTELAKFFGFAAATDFLDGWLARILGQTTKLGRFLDQFADKVVVVPVYLALVCLHRLPLWVLIITALREFGILALRILGRSKQVNIQSGLIGKAKTQFQLWGAAFMIAHYECSVVLLGVRLPVIDFHTLGLRLTYISLIPSLWSAFQYLRAYFKPNIKERA